MNAVLKTRDFFEKKSNESNMPRGGKRPGAGKRKGTTNAKTAAKCASAAGLLDHLEERKMWDWIITKAKKKNDVRTVLDVMKYLTDRRDGKAAQAVVVGGVGGGPPTMRVIIWDVSKGPPKEIMDPQSAGLTPTSP